jgi:prolyl-tRNA editing enzyme YbaK/EbsC (Cys-tRNA(Pro) deacylase)
MALSGPERFAAATAAYDLSPRRMPDSTRTAAEAAQAVGCPVGAIVKSLVFVLVTPEGREPVLALVSGDRRADLDRLAAALGVERGGVEKADATTVKASTGFSIGGVPPIGHPAPLRTVVDADLLRFAEVWSAAGSVHDVFPADPHDLVAWSSGILAPIGVPV